MHKRINSVDGWRAIAALGVLYTHAWAMMHFPKSNIWGIDWLRIANLLGQGVHLFFVISGFCFFGVMHKTNFFSLSGMLTFWKKRWLRIAPAFYVACTFVLLINFSGLRLNFPQNYLFNLLFVPTYFSGAEISGIYWSLSIEWIFYLVLPLVFLVSKYMGELPLFVVLLLSCMVLNMMHYAGILLPSSKIWYYSFFANYGHFVWGLLLGYVQQKQLTRRLPFPAILFVMGLLIAYTGKWLFTATLIERLHQWGFVAASVGPFVMTFGFAVMMYVSLNHMFIGQVIGNRIFSWIGRISYSFYLWHAVILNLVFSLAHAYLPETAWGLMGLILITLTVLLPVSKLSYVVLESFYFSKKTS